MADADIKSAGQLMADITLLLSLLLAFDKIQQFEDKKLKLINFTAVSTI